MIAWATVWAELTSLLVAVTAHPLPKQRKSLHSAPASSCTFLRFSTAFEALAVRAELAGPDCSSALSSLSARAFALVGTSNSPNSAGIFPGSGPAVAVAWPNARGDPDSLG